jgi:GNAT superfamily N-acetyltransferase
MAVERRMEEDGAVWQRIGSVAGRLSRMYRQPGPAATVRFLLSRLFRYEVHWVYEAALTGPVARSEWEGGETLEHFDAENLDAGLTRELERFLGGPAAVENLQGVRGGDTLYVVRDGDRYLNRGYVLYKTRAKKLIGELEKTPLIAYCFTAPEARGRGLYRRALMAELRRLKEQGHNRAVIEVDPGNVPSIRGIEGAGFTKGREIGLWIMLNWLVIRRMREQSGTRWQCFFV